MRYLKMNESTEIQVFNSFDFGTIRTLEENGQVWFIGKDVANALGYSNTRDAIAKHVDEEDKDTVAFRDGNKGNPNQIIINESGMYALIFGSKLPTAKKFKHWVTSEVLPTIRKKGYYALASNFYLDPIPLGEPYDKTTGKTIYEKLLERENRLTRNEVKRLERKNDALKAEIKQLKQENRALEGENFTLTNDLAVSQIIINNYGRDVDVKLRRQLITTMVSTLLAYNREREEIITFAVHDFAEKLDVIHSNKLSFGIPSEVLQEKLKQFCMSYSPVQNEEDDDIITEGELPF